MDMAKSFWVRYQPNGILIGQKKVRNRRYKNPRTGVEHIGDAM